MKSNSISIITDNDNFYNQLLHFIPPNVSYKITRNLDDNTILIISDGVDDSVYENENIPIFIIADAKPDIDIPIYFYEHGNFDTQIFLHNFYKELSIFQNKEKYQLEIDKLNEEIELKNAIIKDYEQNMTKAERVQLDIMTAINMGGYDTSILYRPYKKVSGDLFLAEDFGDKTYIMIGDVVNHGYFSGLYGASIYSLAKSYLMTTARLQMDIVDWARFLQRTSSIYQGGASTKQEEAVTVLLCEIDRLSNRAKFLNCGHGSELPILINLHSKEKARFIEFENKIMPPIGGPLIQNISDYVIEINFFKGNGLIFYSDGIPETFQTQNEDTENLYSKERMLSSIKQELKNKEWTPNSLVNSVIKDLKSYSFGINSEDQTDNNNNIRIDNIHDDITMACIFRTRE